MLDRERLSQSIA